MKSIKSRFSRILLKLSGESLASKKNNENINSITLDYIVQEVSSVTKLGIELGIVIGGGNIWRGGRQKKISRITADYMGMLATQINSLALHDTLIHAGIPVVIESALEMPKIAEFYKSTKTIEYLKKKNIVIFSCGTGNPYFTTDTAAALRAVEIDADVFLKATQVDGVFSSDPVKNKSAVKYKSLTFGKAIEKQLAIMDMTSFTLCMENKLPVIVFNFYKPGNLLKIITGEKIGTEITNG